MSFMRKIYHKFLEIYNFNHICIQKNSKGDFVLKNRCETYVLKTLLQNKSKSYGAMTISKRAC